MHGLKYGESTSLGTESTHESGTLRSSRARLVLEAQAYVLRFLRKFLDQVLLKTHFENLTGLTK